MKYLLLIFIFLVSCRVTDPTLSNTYGKVKHKKVKVERVKYGNDKHCPRWKKNC